MYIYEIYYVSFVISCYVFTHLSHNYSPAEGISTTINQDLLQKCLQGLNIEQTGGNHRSNVALLTSNRSIASYQ